MSDPPDLMDLAYRILDDQLVDVVRQARRR